MPSHHSSNKSKKNRSRKEDSDDEETKVDPQQQYYNDMHDYIQENTDLNTQLDQEDIEGLIETIKKFNLAERKRKQKPDVMPFGKFKGKSIKSIHGFDPQYLTWLKKQDMMDSFPDLLETIKECFANN